MNYSILIPSRGRPKNLIRLLNSISGTISGENVIHIYIGIDSDDKYKEDYFQELSHFIATNNPSLYLCVNMDRSRPLYIIWNELCSISMCSSWSDYIILSNDDVIYETPNWDIILSEKILDSEHPYHLYWFNDGINGESFAAHPIISHMWVRTLGYYLPSGFMYFYTDTWLYDIAKKADVLEYIPEVSSPHKHFSQNASLTDDTYMRNRNNRQNEKDHAEFIRRERERIIDADKIKMAVNEWIKIKPKI